MAAGWFDWLKRRAHGSHPAGLLTRLRTDRRGNTLAMAAAALIPLAGMVGGGIDMSRMYIAKTRMQHACDAGALAGRKAMGGGTFAANSNYPRTSAERFFDANFKTGSYGSQPVTRSFSENAGTVTGTATLTLPMTLMRVLGKTTETLTVVCDARMQLPNTDVMFVLDVTGSMNCVAGDTACGNNGNVPATGSKIDGLKFAVKCFYETVANLNTGAVCPAGNPSGGASAAQVRFGFMPYSTNVNVGRLLPTAYFANSWKYQSREAEWNAGASSTTWNQTGQTRQTTSGSASSTQAQCNDETAAYYYNSHTETVSSDGNTRTVKDQTADADRWSGGTCYGTITVVTTTYAKATQTGQTFRRWHYGQITTNIAGLKNGTTWRTGFALPLGPSGGSRTIPWDGCIEERQTVRQSSYSPIPSGAKDLDIDSAPTSDSTTQWAPALPQLIYTRARKTSDYNSISTADQYTSDEYYQVSGYCPSEARKLTAWSTANDFSSYVDGLGAIGNTYHDIGMLWGARFMSPTGIFSSENATTSDGEDIQRHLIFMTDGDATSSPCDYNAYGIPFYDQRTTTDVGAGTACGAQRTALADQINARLAALCTAVKNKNITLWVISFGGGVNTATETRLETCASAGKYYKADSNSSLQIAFASIAAQISQLRLTR